MITQLEKEVVFRFLKTRKNDGFLNIISIFSFIGISLGVAVLIIVMSVMNGFRTELINKIIGFNAHAVVQQSNAPLKLINDTEFTKNILSNDGEAVILNKDNTKGIFLKGYLENDYKKLQIVNNKEYYGSTSLNNNSISIGKELSIYLNVNINDKITVMSPAGIQTLVGTLPKQETFKIISIFDSGLSEFNENIAYINLETLENFFNKKKREQIFRILFQKSKEYRKT